MLANYLAKLGLNEKEQAIYLMLASMGVQPASIVARRLTQDRVVTYKHLKKLESMGLVKVFIRDGIQCFGITGAEGIESHLEDRNQTVAELADLIPDIATELKTLTRGEGFVPTLQVFQGKSGIKSLFRDLLFEAKSEKLLRIRMMTSNTFDQQMGSVALSKFMGDFFRDAKESNLSIEIIEASGTLLPEYIRRIDPRHFDPDELPASRGATNVFLVGTALYLACYGDSQIGLKIKQEQMSRIFHFFFDAISKNLPPPDIRPPTDIGTWLKPHDVTD
ncbi:MAG: hypothetical protein KBA40_03595 [Candidatus Peribacteraceae bacterium]|nr:hypothetical protein [Candidatus Peribacteraceae bacterium]